MPDSRFPAAGSPPGASSQRADLSSAAKFQPQRIPTGMPYGKAKQVEQMEQARPMKDGSSPSGQSGPPSSQPAVGQRQPNTPAPIPMGLAGMPPEDIMAAIGHQSSYPQESLAGTSPARAAAFRLQVIRQLATLPYASPEIRSLVPQAEAELNAHSMDHIPMGPTSPLDNNGPPR